MHLMSILNSKDRADIGRYQHDEGKTEIINLRAVCLHQHDEAGRYECVGSAGHSHPPQPPEEEDGGQCGEQPRQTALQGAGGVLAPPGGAEGCADHGRHGVEDPD